MATVPEYVEADNEKKT